MIAVTWLQKDPGGAPVEIERAGIVVGWVYNNTTCAVVMIDGRFVTVAASLLQFRAWRD